MRVLVTGGAGFIGSHVAEHNAKKGDDVLVLDNLSRAEVLGKSVGDPLYNWNYLKDHGNINLVRGDVRNSETVMNVSKDVDVIIHAAAQVAVTTSLSNPRTDFEINALGTFNILEAARSNDAALIYCGTNKAYGENVNKIPVIEDTERYLFADKTYKNGIPETFSIDLCGHSPYGCSKLAGDLYIQDYAQTYGLKTGIFRMSCIYGEKQFGVEDQGWVAWFTIATITGKSITIYGDGKQVRDILYINDLIQAFDAFLQRRNQLSGEVFNIGGGPENTLSLLELLDILEQLTRKRSKIGFSDWRPSDQKVYVSNISKAKKKLGWCPKVSPKEGVKRLADWVSENKHLFR